MPLVKYHGYGVVMDYAAGYGPVFSNELMKRIHQKLATNVVVTGEAGIGKSYMAMDICRVLMGLDKNGEDRFSLNQVVFTYKDFMDLVLKLKPGYPIVFDEPSYAMGKREWYNELNKALVQTIESFRFKMHPLFIPIINKSLLDKTIRAHLIQFQVLVHGRGQATVYKLKSSQFEDKMFHKYFCDLKIGVFDKSLCDLPSCLDCPKLMEKNSEEFVCNIFRARYERKKASVQDVRYEQARDLAEKIEVKKLTMTQIENISLSLKNKFLKNGKIDVQALCVALTDDYGIRLSNTRAYQLRAMLLKHHPEIIEVTEPL